MRIELELTDKDLGLVREFRDYHQFYYGDTYHAYHLAELFYQKVKHLLPEA